MYQGSFNSVSGKFQKSFKEVSRVFQEKVSRLFRESFKGVTMMIEFFKDFSVGFKGLYIFC